MRRIQGRPRLRSVRPARRVTRRSSSHRPSPPTTVDRVQLCTRARHFSGTPTRFHWPCGSAASTARWRCVPSSPRRNRPTATPHSGAASTRSVVSSIRSPLDSRCGSSAVRLQCSNGLALARPGQASPILLRQMIHAGDLQPIIGQCVRHAGHGQALACALLKAQRHAGACITAREEHAGRTLVAGHTRCLRQRPGRRCRRRSGRSRTQTTDRSPSGRRWRTGGARPAETELALEIVLHPAIASAQHIGNAAFRARQPRGHEGIGGIDFPVHPERPPAQEDRDDRYAIGRAA